MTKNENRSLIYPLTFILMLLFFVSCNNSSKKDSAIKHQIESKPIAVDNKEGLNKMNNYQNYISDKMVELINEIPDEQRNQIYVISLFVYNDDDDPRKPTLTFGYNTIKQVSDSKEKASSEDEARWNYAFWLQNELYVFGRGKDKKLKENWLKENQLFYIDPFIDEVNEDEYDEDFDIDEAGDRITSEYSEMIMRIVSDLHKSGVIKKAFNKPIPLLIHGLLYSRKDAERNKLINPKEVVLDFVNWVESFSIE